LAKLDGAAGELEHLRDEKDQEIAILQEGMDTTLQQLSESQQVCPRQPINGLSAHNKQTQGLADEATDAQIDTLILDNRKKLNQIIGTFLLF
jgi:huntingtin-interacting protein 1-related protein